MNLQVRNILVAGAGGNLGRQVVADLAPLCKSIIAVDRAFPEPFAAKNIHQDNVELTDDVAITQAFDRWSESIGHIDAVVNLAGKIHSEPLFNLMKRPDGRHALDTWTGTLTSNLDTAFLLCREAAARMASTRKPGVLINFSSIAAQGNIGQTAYTAAKAALEAMTVTWSKELGVFGIRVCAIAPGFIDTPSTREALSQTIVDQWTKQVPLRRLGTAAEVSHAVRFILENDYYNGQVLHLDGGLRI
jgi:3-oxoacyl-[acyl-carrier protein] reductase